MRDRMGRDPIELTEYAAPGTSGPRSVQVSCACAACDWKGMSQLLSAGVWHACSNPFYSCWGQPCLCR